MHPDHIEAIPVSHPVHLLHVVVEDQQDSLVVYTDLTSNGGKGLAKVVAPDEMNQSAGHQTLVVYIWNGSGSNSVLPQTV